jgi:predicted amidohydrolase
MRVALLQVQLDPKSGATNVQRINAAIDRAAGADPPPDLLVLPGGCDTGGAAPGRAWPAAALESVKANIALKAREWGLYVAAGSHVVRDESLLPCALLFDADGDLAMGSVGAASSQDVGGLMVIDPWDSGVGRLAVLEPTSAARLADLLPDGGSDVLVAVPLSPSLTGKHRRVVDAAITSLRDKADMGGNAYWAVVATASGEGSPDRGDGPRTFLRAPDGGILASADSTGEAVVCVDVPLTPV